MKRNIKKSLGFLAIANLLLSCGKQDDFAGEVASSHAVNILFSSSSLQSAPVSGETGNFNTLVFRQEGTSVDKEKEVRWLPLQTSWSQMESGNYKMSCQLETGIYHFSLSKGMKVVDTEEAGNNGTQCFWVKESEPRALSEYVVQHPKYSDGNLKECTEELFLDGDDMLDGKDVCSQQEFDAELSHIQARLDLIMAYQGGGQVSPFARIKEVKIELPDINAYYSLTGEEVQNGGKAKFMQTLVSTDFEGFDMEVYSKEFIGETAFPEGLQNVTSQTARIKKWVFFPTQDVTGIKLHVTYKNGYEQDVPVDKLDLGENKATIVVVWVSKEHLQLEPEGVFGGKLTGGDVSGENGFWN